MGVGPNQQLIITLCKPQFNSVENISLSKALSIVKEELKFIGKIKASHYKRYETETK